jgi:hypothetical protein
MRQNPNFLPLIFGAFIHLENIFRQIETGPRGRGGGVSIEPDRAEVSV